MPQSKGVKNEQARLRMQKMRNKKSVTTDNNVTQYPAILLALTDPIKRVKLENIYQSLSDFKQAENVYYGCRMPFDVVGDLLEVTK